MYLDPFSNIQPTISSSHMPFLSCRDSVHYHASCLTIVSFLQYTPAHWTTEHRAQPVNQVTAFARSIGRSQNSLTKYLFVKASQSLCDEIILIWILQSWLWNDLTSIVKNKEATRWCCVVTWKSCSNSNWHLVICQFFWEEPSVMLAVVPLKHLWGCTVTPLMLHFQNFVDSGVQTMLTVL